MLLSFLATVIAYTAPIVAARGRGGGGSVDVNLTLDLSSINTATFSFFIIFAIFTAFQAWVALGLTRNHNEHCTAAPFVILLFATLLLVAYYAMGAVYVSLGLSRSKFTDLGGGFYAMLSFTDRVVDVLVAGAIAMLLDNRMTYMVQHHGWIPANRMLKRIIEMSLLSVMMLVIVIGVIIRGVALTTSDFRSALKASANLYHAYIAFYIFITAHISVTSIALSSRMSLANVTDPITKTIAFWVSPLLITRALVRLSIDIVTSTRSINWDSEILLLVELLITGTIYFVVIAVISSLGGVPQATESSDAGSEVQKA